MISAVCYNLGIGGRRNNATWSCCPCHHLFFVPQCWSRYNIRYWGAFDRSPAVVHLVVLMSWGLVVVKSPSGSLPAYTLANTFVVQDIVTKVLYKSKKVHLETSPSVNLKTCPITWEIIVPCPKWNQYILGTFLGLPTKYAFHTFEIMLGLRKYSNVVM